MLRGVGHDRGLAQALGVEGRPDRRHLAIHHRARGNDLGTGPRLADRGRGESDESRVVVDRSIGSERPAVTMVGVLAQAGVGDRHERQLERSDPPEGILDDPVVGRCLGALRVLRIWQAKEDDPPTPSSAR